MNRHIVKSKNSASSWASAVLLANTVRPKPPRTRHASETMLSSRVDAPTAGTLQRSAINSSPIRAIPPVVHETLRSPGQPLEMATRAFMERRFGADFSNVRVHADSQAAESAGAVNAHAYAAGNHIVFGSGKFAPHLNDGKRLIAHELTHTIQANAKSPAEVRSIAPEDPAEREADRVAHSVLQQAIEPCGIAHVGREAALRRQPIYPQDVDKTLDPKTPPLAGPYPTPKAPPPPPAPPVAPCLISEDCKKSIRGSAWDFGKAADQKQADTEKEMKSDPKKAKALGKARPAANLKAFADKADPKILAKISQVRVLPEMAGAAGGQASDCNGNGPQAGMPACIEVPDKLERQAERFNNTKEPKIDEFSRLEWKTLALSTLVHESEHVAFSQAPPVSAGRTTNAQSVFQFSPDIFLFELDEMNALFTEYPVQYRGIMADTKKDAAQKTADVRAWITDYAIGNGDEDLRGMLKKLRCISPCADVNKAVKDVFNKQSTGWTKEQKDLFVGIVADPKQGLDWPK
jgi:hypothetical protein